MNRYIVTFRPDNRKVEVDRDTTLLQAALRCGVYLYSACGGDGVCGRCRVKVLSGKVESQPSPAVVPGEQQGDVYLACLTMPRSDLEVEVPPESRIDLDNLSDEERAFRLRGLYSQAEEVEVRAPEEPVEHFSADPLAVKVYMELPQATMDDRISDLERLYRGIRGVRNSGVIHMPLAGVRGLSTLMRDAGWKVTVTLGERDGALEVVQVSSGDGTGRNYGIALDIGTTTISGQLIDARCGRILGTKAAYNKQASFGSDVITRIIYSQKEQGLQQLHMAVADTINSIIRALATEHGVDLNDINYIVSAGNTTMTHLLLSIDPGYIRREPYTPTANFVPVCRAAQTGLQINPHGLLFCAPGVASYVGGDIVAGVLSSGLFRQEELSLLIDIGTNGEIVLGNREFMVACAASAGPAFEGTGVTCGMRASAGAIQSVKISPQAEDITCETIAGGPVCGICGSGYISALQAFLREGLIDKNGKFRIEDHARLRTGGGGREFVLVARGEQGAPGDVVITEADIDNIKRAKAAIYAAASTLAASLEIKLSEVKNIFIAGGFGTSLDIESGVAIGLLPDVDRSRFRFIGNTSLAGARQVLLSRQAARAVRQIASRITYLELSAHQGYMDEYMAALFFPHTDAARFPGAG